MATRRVEAKPKPEAKARRKRQPRIVYRVEIVHAPDPAPGDARLRRWLAAVLSES